MATLNSLSSMRAFHFSFRNNNNNNERKLPPIQISTDPSRFDLLQLRDLLKSTNQACHRFPVFENGSVKPVDLDKLRLALSNSSIIVSAFCKSSLYLEDCYYPQEQSKERLVGFGRAVSDSGLTASLHDIAVLPQLQGLGMGQMILKRIIRILTSKGIYDISALCTEKERLFFEACGFADDALGSTTMMYTRSPSSYNEGDPMVKRAGRMLLLVPPVLEPFSSKKAATD